MMESILENTNRPSIIILQGDHGPASTLDWDNPTPESLKERFSILNAYYFFDQDYSNLYQTITPVNTFRIILNQYLNGNYQLLEDENYFSRLKSIFRFRKVSRFISSAK